MCFRIKQLAPRPRNRIAYKVVGIVPDTRGREYRSDIRDFPYTRGVRYELDPRAMTRATDFSRLPDDRYSASAGFYVFLTLAAAKRDFASAWYVYSRHRHTVRRPCIVKVKVDPTEFLFRSTNIFHKTTEVDERQMATYRAVTIVGRV